MAVSHHDPDASKILKMVTKNEVDSIRRPLEEFGPVQYVEKHCVKDTIIVVFRNIIDAQEAYSNLKDNLVDGLEIESVEYVQKTIKSDGVDKVWGS